MLGCEPSGPVREVHSQGPDLLPQNSGGPGVQPVLRDRLHGERACPAAALGSRLCLSVHLPGGRPSLSGEKEGSGADGGRKSSGPSEGSLQTLPPWSWMAPGSGTGGTAGAAPAQEPRGPGSTQAGAHTPSQGDSQPREAAHVPWASYFLKINFFLSYPMLLCVVVTLSS